MKTFFNIFQAADGDIFLGCNIGLLQYKVLFLKLLHGEVTQLKWHNLLTISIDNLLGEA